MSLDAAYWAPLIVALAAWRIAGARPLAWRGAFAAAGAGGAGALAFVAGTAAHALLLACTLAAVAWAVVAGGGGAGFAPPARAALILGRGLALATLVVLLVQPAAEVRVTRFERPPLPILLDDSRSMSIVDRAADDAVRGSRAERVAGAAAKNRSKLSDLDALYDVQPAGLAGGRADAQWRVAPAAALSPLAAALRRSADARSPAGIAPRAVILVSDGGENVESAAAVRSAADELARRGCALLAVGVGPDPARTPAIELEPLAAPAKLRVRERLRVRLAARVRGCAGATVEASVRWSAEHGESVRIALPSADEAIEREFTLLPPALGVYRLTASVRLPAELGGDVSESSALVEVVADRIRVLLVEGGPRPEAGAIARALRGAEEFEVETVFQAAGGAAPALDTSGYDVVLLGLGRAPGRSALEEISRAIREDGLGLLLAGGRAMWSGGSFRATALEDFSPVALPRGATREISASKFVPTDEGTAHAILAGLSPQTLAALPPLLGVCELGRPKSLSEILATSESGEPLLVVGEFGRGRVAAAAWEATWPWSLASDEGAELHHAFWRQTVSWLANRRPRGWVVPDAAAYPSAAIESGRRIRVRAGVSGLTTAQQRALDEQLIPRLVLRLAPAGSQPAAPSRGGTTIGADEWEISLRRQGDAWSADLPTAALAPLRSGRYELNLAFRPRPAGASAPSATTASAAPKITLRPEELAASATFDVTDVDVEHRAPTANLALLREAAERSAAAGGRYFELEEVDELIRELSKSDRRTRLDQRVRISPTQSSGGWLLLLLTAAYALEWAIRRAGGGEWRIAKSEERIAMSE